MKDLRDAAIIIAAFALGVMANHTMRDNNLTCAHAVLHNNVAKCAVYIDKDVVQ